MEGVGAARSCDFGRRLAFEAGDAGFASESLIQIVRPNLSFRSARYRIFSEWHDWPLGTILHPLQKFSSRPLPAALSGVRGAIRKRNRNKGVA